MCKVMMTANKETKGTIQFKEIVAAGEKAVIGTLYVPKETLKAMNWTHGKDIAINVSIPRGQGEANAVDEAPAAPAATAQAKKTAVKTAAKRGGRRKTA